MPSLVEFVISSTVWHLTSWSYTYCIYTYIIYLIKSLKLMTSYQLLLKYFTFRVKPSHFCPILVTLASMSILIERQTSTESLQMWQKRYAKIIEKTLAKTSWKMNVKFFFMQKNAIPMYILNSCRIEVCMYVLCTYSSWLQTSELLQAWRSRGYPQILANQLTYLNQGISNNTWVISKHCQASFNQSLNLPRC